MRHLVLIRHGESELNALSRTVRTYCGQNETPLTELGRQQAAAAGRKLAEFDFVRPAAAVSSPLSRAVETLKLVLSQLATPVAVLPPAAGIKERSHGVFEGQSEVAVHRDYPHYRDDPAYCRFMNHYDQCAPGGETLAIVTHRAWSAVSELLDQTTGDLIVVSHFNPIRCVLGQALNYSREQTLKLHIPNAEPIVLGHNGEFKLVHSPELAAAE